MQPHRFATIRKPLIAISLLLIATALVVAGGAVAKKKHKRLRLTCDQTTEEIFKTAEQFRQQHNAAGWTIEPAPDGLLVGSGCKNVAPRTRQGSAYLADVHYPDDGSPPFPGETNPSVYAYHWFWTETVTRTRKGRLRDTITDSHCQREAIGPAPDFDIQVLPC
ncbi:MAG TPA: hypothetical protein VH501_08815 [Solirubrobacterales bacterium]